MTLCGVERQSSAMGSIASALPPLVVRAGDCSIASSIKRADRYIVDASGVVCALFRHLLIYLTMASNSDIPHERRRVYATLPSDSFLNISFRQGRASRMVRSYPHISMPWRRHPPDATSLRLQAVVFAGRRPRLDSIDGSPGLILGAVTQTPGPD